MREELRLKRIQESAIASAMEKAEQYRLLNQPSEAESICLDILEVDGDNQQALICLLLALTDQFGAEGFGVAERRARDVIARLTGEYERLYYAGLVAERRAKAQLRMAVMGHMVYEGLKEAMELYERAEKLRPDDCEDATLRWNACVRVLLRNPALRPEVAGDEPYEPYLE